MRQFFQRGRLGEPYDAMVKRVHALVLDLLGAAERGDRCAAAVTAERLVAQAGALEELLRGVISSAAALGGLWRDKD